ncbi:MAG: hypothetical protein H0U38_06615 [Chloroflexia bacterium]|nr:hypothetical protein [Chloroflexia bacterium]
MQAGTVPGHHRSSGRSRGLPLLPAAIIGIVALMALTFRSSLPFLSDPSDPYGTTLPGAFLYQQQRKTTCFRGERRSRRILRRS